jgi:hypothetical protein
MALAFSAVNNAVGTPGTFREVIYDVTLDSSYPTGGEAINGKDVGLQSIYGLSVIGISSVVGTAKTTEVVFSWDFKNGKLQAWRTGTSADTDLNEVANGQSLSTYVVRVRVAGI